MSDQAWLLRLAAKVLTFYVVMFWLGIAGIILNATVL